MHYITFALGYLLSPGLGLLIGFLNNKTPQNYIFGNCEGPFTPKVKWIMKWLAQAKGSASAPHSEFLSTPKGELSVNTKVTCEYTGEYFSAESCVKVFHQEIHY